MKKSISQWSFAGGISIPKGCMKLAKDAGFEAIELALDEDGPINLGSTREEIEEIARTARKIGIEISSVATGLFWKYPFTSASRETREKAEEITVKMLDVAQWLGTDAILVVPGVVGVDFIPEGEVIPYDLAYARSMEALKELAREAERRRVYIGIENVWNKFLLSPLEMRDFVDRLGSEYVGVYFDVGNVIATGYPEQWIRILGKRIKRLHFKDFRRAVGGLSGFVDLLEGDVNWSEVMKALEEVGYDSYATAEMLPPYAQYPEALIYNTSRAMDYIFGIT
ncbi:MAG TPA: sugar phosphate isomerase/epimerase [Candidatus Latescibacteria bacterium]|nr:sugar phosphate isomerase/epimerase [Candidatus Latescibacterota bacterium]